MKKISSKIIVIVLLAVFLWSGLGIFSVKNTYALTTGDAADAAMAVGFYSAGPFAVAAGDIWNMVTPDSWKKASTPGVVAKGAAGTWMIDKVTRATAAVNGFLLQAILIPLLVILTSIAGRMLDWAVLMTLSTSIFQSTSFGVITVWALIRNICNITFIFILLYAAINMIIGSDTATTKKTIANVVIAALLINFSYFITRILIDAGNILAVALYNQIQASSYSVGGAVSTFAGQGIGTVIMQSLGMSGFMSASSAAAAPSGSFSVAYLVVSYLQALTLIIAFVVFIYALILMLTRIVVLVFLIALSPIAFMGKLLPTLEEYSKMWWVTLRGQVMIAPIFLLFIYLMVKVADAFNNPAIGPIPESSKAYLSYFKYLMMIMLLVVAVKTTKKMTGAVGSAIEGFAKAAIGLAIGAATGGAAMVARQTIGRAATNRLAEKGDDLRARAATGDVRARLELATLEKTSKSTFDARNSKILGGASKAFSSVSGQLGVQMPGLGKPGSLSGMVGLGGTVAENRKAQQEALNKEYTELEKSVTGKQRLAAAPIIERRDAMVKTQLETAGTPHGDQHIALKTQKDALINVVSTGPGAHKEFATINKDLKEAEDAADEANKDLAKIVALAPAAGATDAEKAQHLSQVAAARANADKAKKDVAAQNRVKADKVKALEKENKERNAAQIDALDDQMKAIKLQTEKAVEKTMAKVDQDMLGVVNKARNYADSVRNGRSGTVSSMASDADRAKMANKMETQREAK